MTISLQNAMKIGGLRDCRVIAGYQGLDVEISYVTIMEVPDIVQWLKGNELLLTSLYPIKDDAKAQQQLIQQLHNQGTSALAIKPNRFVENIPMPILEEAEKYGFPVIEIPERISYLDILSPVMNTIFDRKVVLQEDLEEAYRLLNEVSLNESGIHHLIDMLTHLTKHNIAIESLVSFVDTPLISSSFQDFKYQQIEELEHVQRPIRLTRKNHQGETISCITAPIIVDGTLYGAISSWDQTNDHIEADLAILERASSVLALEFMRKKVRYEVELQYKSDFFRALFKGNIDKTKDLEEKAKAYNILPERQYICCAIYFELTNTTDTFLTDHLTKLEMIIHQIETRAVIGMMHNVLYILYPTNGKGEEKALVDLQRFIREFEKMFAKTPYAGTGRVSGNNFIELQETFEQAELALSISRSLKLQDSQLVHYDDLGVYRLLAQMGQNEEMIKFYNETIGILADYDEKHNLELIRSVEEYFYNNESVSSAAEALYIHVNTLKYRLQKVRALTGYSFQDSEGKLMIQLGLKIGHFSSNDYRFR
ncbi:PucR family transcriptional regulator [Salibacterium salarium]|uniref:PucR family transcriptional regulator n=1 Tax=Salibacterium salarium TaxID=284579 RepID=A0A3R9RB64_9BACI|nr:PucR family transcriptional regulator [Salibacterium salarium]RSL31439.1 PucR family transcriptional regulator [Salibacterium salarium]